AGARAVRRRAAAAGGLRGDSQRARDAVRAGGRRRVLRGGLSPARRVRARAPAGSSSPRGLAAIYRVSAVSTERVVELLRRDPAEAEYDEIRELWKKHSIAEDNRDLPGLISTLTA